MNSLQCDGEKKMDPNEKGPSPYEQAAIDYLLRLSINFCRA